MRNKSLLHSIMILVAGLLMFTGIHAADEAPTIGFFGAARCYGGSCHLLNTGTQKILLDCGSFMEAEMAEHNRSFPETLLSPSTTRVWE